MKWDGEWQLTIEMFRDLGLAFAAVLVIIYLLVVGWFQSFKTPLLIMAAIPGCDADRGRGMTALRNTPVDRDGRRSF
jgi:Cu/Ag efflux pump CusA